MLIRTFTLAFLSLVITAWMPWQTSLEARSLIVRLSAAAAQSGQTPSALQQNLALLNSPPANVFSFGKISGTDSQLRSATAERAQLMRYRVIELRPGVDADAVIEELKADPSIDDVQVNGSRQMPPLRKISAVEMEEGEERISDNWALEKCEFPQAWESATGDGVVIAVIDTGVDYLHPDLIDNLFVNEAEDLNGNGRFEPWRADETDSEGLSGDLDGIDNDGNGYTDDVIGYDMVDQAIRNFGDDRNRDGIPFDENGHGTAVAGVLAAVRGNNIGLIGAAPNAKVLSVRAFDVSGNAEDDDMAAAIVYAAIAGADIINLSFGDIFHSPILRDAARFAASLNCLLVSSAGNDGSTLSHYPSNHAEVLSIGATTSEDNLAIFSVRGSTVDMVAPGVEVPTTEVGGGYRLVSGTSFAAPYVAAAAALLLERSPDADVRSLFGVLQASSDDLGEPGWDDLFSNGRLNAARAVERIGGTQVSILSPAVDSEFTRGAGETIEVEIDAATPLFEWYQVSVGAGREPREWTAITLRELKQLRSGVAVALPADELTEGTHTLRLQVSQTNGQILETRRRIDVVSSELEASVSDSWAWSGFRRILVVEGESSRRTRMSLRYWPAGNPDVARSLDDFARLTRGHHIPVREFDIETPVYSVEVVFEALNGETVKLEFDVNVPKTEAPERGFSERFSGAPDSYLLDQVAPLAGPGSEVFVVNDISTGDFGAIKTYRYDNELIVALDSLEERWIPRGIGDSDGDGILEVFAQSGGESVLFEAEQAGGNPFARQIFSERETGQFWASAMYDFDNDGREELLVRSDSDYMLYDFRDDAYVKVADAPNSSAGSAGGPNLFGPPVAAIGNFDEDANIEICFGDLDADFLIYEYRNGAFVLEHLLENDGSSGSQFVTAVDVDGDGNDELLLGFHAAVEPNFRREYDTPLWTYLLVDLQGEKVDTLWQEQFYGLRVASGFRNGVAAGQLDDRPGEEFVIAGFPNLYVFSRGESREEPAFEVLWHFPAALTNSAVIYDFDKNGRNEIGFNTNGGLRFYEFDGPQARPDVPTGLRGWATGATTAFLEWEPVENAREYVVVRLSLVDGKTVTEELPPITQNRLNITGLEPGRSYFFGVVSINESSFPENPASVGSRLIEVFTHETVRPLTAELIGSQVLQLNFSGPMSPEAFAPGNFRLWRSDAPESVMNPTSVVSATETSINLYISLPPGKGAHVIEVASLTDLFGAPTTPAELQFNVGEEAPPELFLLNLEVVDRTNLILTYSEAVERNSALNSLNYDLQPLGQIEEVTLSMGRDDQVGLRLDESAVLGALGQFYTVQVTNVVTPEGSQMTLGAGNTLGFTFTEEDLQEVFAYPNPVRYGEEEEMTFAGLTQDAEVTVLSMEGRVLARLTEVDGNGGVNWNLRDLDGNILESGVYLYRVTGSVSGGQAFESEMKKFVVLRGE